MINPPHVWPNSSPPHLNHHIPTPYLCWWGSKTQRQTSMPNHALVCLHFILFFLFFWEISLKLFIK